VTSAADTDPAAAFIERLHGAALAKACSVGRPHPVPAQHCREPRSTRRQPRLTHRGRTRAVLAYPGRRLLPGRAEGSAPAWSGAGLAKRVAITFDDGYAGNLHVAYPVLRHHAVPFTVYVTTGFMDREVRVWWYGLERLWRSTASPLSTRGALPVHMLHARAENSRIQVHWCVAVGSTAARCRPHTRAIVRRPGRGSA
jgi:hypothetical protein